IRDFHVTGVQTCALPISLEVGGGDSPGVGQDVGHDEDALVGQYGVALHGGRAVGALHYHRGGEGGGLGGADGAGEGGGHERLARSEERRVGKGWRWEGAR